MLFGGSCLLAPRLGGETLPKLSEGSIVVTSEKLPGINLDASLKVVHRIESVLTSFPEVKRVVSLTGSAELPTDPMGIESTDSFITLADPTKWTTAQTQNGLVAAFERRLEAEVPGVAYSFSHPIQMRMDDLMEGVRGDVAISLCGDDLAVLKDKADAIVRTVSAVPGAADVKAEAQGGMPAHQALHAPATDRSALRAQGRMHPRRAIALMMPGMDAPDVVEELTVRHRPSALVA